MTITATMSEPDLVRWGERIGASIETPVFLALHGPLGAGKSVLARAIGRGAGVEDIMPSPTFNLSFRYRGRGDRHVVHMDLYRLRAPEELDALAWSELGEPGEIALVEWAERAGAALPERRWDVRIVGDAGRPDFRRIVAESVGEPPPLPEPSLEMPSGP